MSFQEKSAWVMLVALVLTGVFYFYTVFAMSEGGVLASPVIAVLVIFTVIQVVIAVLGHVVIAIASPQEANAKTDERERRILTLSGHWSGMIFGVCVLASLGLYLVTHSGDLLFYTVFGSLVLSSIIEFAMHIWLQRRFVS